MSTYIGWDVDERPKNWFEHVPWGVGWSRPYWMVTVPAERYSGTPRYSVSCGHPSGGNGVPGLDRDQWELVARRIAASVNACLGIPIEELEEMEPGRFGTVHSIPTPDAEVEELQRENERLHRELEHARNAPRF